jgi:tRNA pseudouridine13 synthase
MSKEAEETSATNGANIISKVDETAPKLDEGEQKRNDGISQADETEQSLGICTYMVPGEGFSAVVKARYSDFLVHEVDLNGTTARLTSRDVPKDDSGKDDAVAAITEAPKEEKKPTTEWPALEKELQDMVQDADTVALVMKVLKDHNDDNENMEKFVALPELEKSQRKAVHQWIHSSLPCARADTLDGKIRIWHVKFEKEMPNYKLFGNNNDNNNSQRRKKPKASWPDDRPDFLQFVLYKENIDTMTATKELSRKGSKARIGYAGMKDKRGITAQFCTLYRTQPEQIMSTRNHKGGGNTKQRGFAVVEVGNFSYVDKEIRLGSLKGNRFDLALRNVVMTGAEDKQLILESAAKAMKEKGFINYFGTQRFGKYKSTHKTGIAVLQGDFKKAIEIILEPKPDDRPDSVKARKEWQARFQNGETEENEVLCAKKFLKTLNRFMTAENSILQSLSRKPKDYKRAFTCIPKTLRMMFLHAVQSLIWNQAASYRLSSMDKDNVLPGDLVKLEGDSDVKVVTEEEVDKYTMEDIVLPLVGVKSKFPTNELGSVMKKLVNDLGVNVDMFKKIQDKDLNINGDYRKLVIRPKDFDFKIMEYYDPYQPLLRTDLMELNGDDIKITPKKEEETLKYAMMVGFTLPSSAYATVALRELMKRPTSTDYQKDLKLG